MSAVKELVKLGKLYACLGILGLFVFLMINPPHPVNHTIIEAAKASVQSIIVNPTIKNVFMLSLLLYTLFVVVESLSFIRDLAGRLFHKSKENNVTE
ncbi:hypothetical protein [Pelosinus sp. sgz500959]|uniref:hypothetical protein n=1 Tax=Pelosinus sp. sgz500959 TaxID=3242472 RepID=UPI003673019B